MNLTTICGPIIHGTATGRLLGFPTANIALDETMKSALTNTVSICIIDLDDTSYHGVGTYLPHKGVYEVHIFDFDQDIYGQTVTITLVQHIRGNKKFDSDEDLKAQIAKDCAVAREYFIQQEIEETKHLGLISIGGIYLQTTENILNELIVTGNPHMVSGDIEYMQQCTKRSDFNISIPMLFLFFHGIEITMKGLLIKSGSITNIDHDLNIFIKELEKYDYIKNSHLTKILKKYIYKENMHPIMKSFLKENNESNANNFYQFLKYPTDSKNNKTYNYFPIKYKGKEFLSFAKEMLYDINIIRKESIKLYEMMI